VQPPFAHFGCAQRKINALQFPKSAVAGVPTEFRELISEFQLLLLFAPEGLKAVKLLPFVVATTARASNVGAKAIADIADNKINDTRFIFSLAQILTQSSNKTKQKYNF